MKSFKKISFLFFVLLITGCATGKIIPAETAIQNFEVNVSRQQAFDASLAVAQMLNLSVAVLEKQSGLIRFETATLSADQLDQYCDYMAVDPSTNKPWDTFKNWNTRSVENGGGNVKGTVTINILITEKASRSSISMRSNWVASNAREVYPCNSKKIFENDFISKLKAQF